MITQKDCVLRVTCIVIWISVTSMLGMKGFHQLSTGVIIAVGLPHLFPLWPEEPSVYLFLVVEASIHSLFPLFF